MQVRTKALKLAGAAMITVAVAPWLGAGAASAASVTVHLDKKWDGTNSATATVSTAGCAYSEITQIPHNSRGWHFVLPGGSGLSEFTAHFKTAGNVTVTPTDSVDGVIVQGGKGAVIFTTGDDVLQNDASLDGYPGKGTAAAKGNNDMQLSHLCGEGETPPIDECTNIDGIQDQVPDGYTQNQDGTCSPVTSSAPVTTSSSAPQTTTSSAAVVTSNVVTTSQAAASATVSVEGTKAGQTSDAGSTDVAVEGTKTGQLPHTGGGLPVGALAVLSLGLLLLGGSLLLLPGLAVQRTRRH